jgi:hypothetical protein
MHFVLISLPFRQGEKQEHLKSDREAEARYASESAALTATGVPLMLFA